MTIETQITGGGFPQEYLVPNRYLKLQNLTLSHCVTPNMLVPWHWLYAQWLHISKAFMTQENRYGLI